MRNFLVSSCQYLRNPTPLQQSHNTTVTFKSPQYSGQYLNIKTKNHTQKQTITTTLLNMHSFLSAIKVYITQLPCEASFFFNIKLFC